MDIVVKGADFSANRIGKSITAKTQAVIEAFGATLTTPQIEGLNNYLITLEDASLLSASKLTRFYLPVLTTDTTKAFINVADVNLTNDIPTPTEVAYANKGIYNTEVTTTKQLLVPCGSDGIGSDSFTFLGYLTNFDNTVAKGLPQWIQPASSAWYGSMELTSGVDWSNSQGSKIRVTNNGVGITETLNGSAGVLAFGCKNQLFGFTLNQTNRDGGHFMKNNGVASRFYTESGVGYTAGSLTTGLHLSSNNNGWMKLPQGMIAIGLGLTQSELQIVADATKTFMAVMEINNII